MRGDISNRDATATYDELGAACRLLFEVFTDNPYTLPSICISAPASMSIFFWSGSGGASKTAASASVDAQVELTRDDLGAIRNMAPTALVVNPSFSPTIHPSDGCRWIDSNVSLDGRRSCHVVSWRCTKPHSISNLVMENYVATISNKTASIAEMLDEFAARIAEIEKIDAEGYRLEAVSLANVPVPDDELLEAKVFGRSLFDQARDGRRISRYEAKRDLRVTGEVELLARLEAWEAQREEAFTASGLRALEGCIAELQREADALAARIAKTPAATFDDIVLKVQALRIARKDDVLPPRFAAILADDERHSSDRMGAGIVRDVLALVAASTPAQA